MSGAVIRHGPVAGADADVEQIRDLVVQHRLELDAMPIAVFGN